MADDNSWTQRIRKTVISMANNAMWRDWKSNISSFSRMLNWPKQFYVECKINKFTMRRLRIPIIYRHGIMYNAWSERCRQKRMRQIRETKETKGTGSRLRKCILVP